MFSFGWSLPLGSVLGIPVRLHTTFLILLLVQTLAQIPVGKWWVLTWFLVTGPILLATVLIHEIGHCLAARSVGGKAHGILLWPFGGLAFIHHSASPKADMWVAVAGPLTHIPMTGFWVLMSLAATKVAYGTAFVTLQYPWPEPPFLGVTLVTLAIYLNIAIFAFNLFIPAYPLDGGRILVDSLLWFGVQPAPAAKITLGVAVPLALGILVVGAVFVQPMTILSAAFLFWACWQLYDCLRKGQIEQHPLFSFTASQNAAAAAAAGRNMEAGLTGPAAPYGASPYGGAVGGGAAPYGAGGGGGAPSYQFYPPNGVPGGRPAQQPRAPIF